MPLDSESEALPLGHRAPYIECESMEITAGAASLSPGFKVPSTVKVIQREKISVESLI